MNETSHNFQSDSRVRSETGRVMELVDPATENVVGQVTLADREEVARVVRVARDAFDGGWNNAALSARLAVLRQLIERIQQRSGEFAAVISAEIGAPIDFAREHQVEAGLAHLRATLDAAGACDLDQPVSPDKPDHRVRYEPVGVAALITPWNWPLNQVALKVGAALAAGCTMVLKPSEMAPRTGELLNECFEQTDAPKGVFSLLVGDGETGAALSQDPLVDIVSFTGSTRAGRAVALAAAASFKRVALELGGKSPNLLFADCDVDTAVRQGVAHCFRNAGQSCNAASRMLVENAIYDQVVECAAKAAQATAVGLPGDSGRHIGPLVSKTQFERVQSYIRKGIDEGARLVAGGPGRPDGLHQGFFVRPTVFADVTPDMAIARDEIFGPVLTISRFEHEADAVAQANDSEYGLAAYVQTTDTNRADRVARQLRAGMIQVNGRSRAKGAPFGGVKSSGIGREAGLWGIRAFQEVKSISGVSAVSSETD